MKAEQSRETREELHSPQAHSMQSNLRAIVYRCEPMGQ